MDYASDKKQDSKVQQQSKSLPSPAISAMESSADAQKYNQYVGMVRACGYDLDESVGNVNVIGIRGWMDGNVVENVKNQYNDSIIVVYKTAVGDYECKHCKEFLASVDPGTYSGVNAKGSANLMCGQYEYGTGRHKDKYDAFTPTEESYVWRDKNNDGKREETDIEESGNFGINIHAAGYVENGVNDWSEGCQVIASSSKGITGSSLAENNAENHPEFNEFRSTILENDKDHKFIYTLINGDTALSNYNVSIADKRRAQIARLMRGQGGNTPTTK